jgi:hypothetical protein
LPPPRPKGKEPLRGQRARRRPLPWGLVGAGLTEATGRRPPLLTDLESARVAGVRKEPRDEARAERGRATVGCRRRRRLATTGARPPPRARRRRLERGREKEREGKREGCRRGKRRRRRWGAGRRWTRDLAAAVSTRRKQRGRKWGARVSLLTSMGPLTLRGVRWTVGFHPTASSWRRA